MEDAMATNGSLKGTATTRRELLQAMALGGLAAPTLGAALAANPAAATSRLAQQPRSGGTVTLVTPQDFPGLDPTASTIYNSDNLLSLLWNGLTRYDENMDVQP